MQQCHKAYHYPQRTDRDAGEGPRGQGQFFDNLIRRFFNHNSCLQASLGADMFFPGSSRRALYRGKEVELSEMKSKGSYGGSKFGHLPPS